MEHSEREYAEPMYPDGYYNVGAERSKEEDLLEEMKEAAGIYKKPE